jgi:adenine-specific DNA-methyltransferase
MQNRYLTPSNLRKQWEDSKTYLNRFERLLMQLTRHELNGHAEFLSDSSFYLKSCPFPGDIPLGLYELPRRSDEAHLYRLNHPLAEHLLAQAKNRALLPAEVVFDLSRHEGKISILEPLVAQSGHLTVALLTVEALDHAKDYLLMAGITNSGQLLEIDAERGNGRTDFGGETKNQQFNCISKWRKRHEN